MTKDPYKNVSTRATPQSQPVPGRTDMAPNNAGGFAFTLDKWGQLRRFLVLGSSGGTYYVSEQKLTKANADNVIACVNEDGPRTVAELVKVSTENLAPKVQPTIFALAVCAGVGDDRTRAAALDALPVICRTGYHLFKFIGYVENFRGWGRGLRRAVAGWYTDKDPAALAYQLIKYQQREGWSNRDLLRLSHPLPVSPELNAVFRYVVGKDVDLDALPPIIGAMKAAQATSDTKEIVRLIQEHNLPFEALPSEVLREPAIWEVLAPKQGLTALIRNLGRMSSIGALTQFSDMTSVVLDRLNSREALQKAKVHPFAVLLAMTTYQAGRGVKGSMTWKPVTQVVNALDRAFYLAFDNVVPSGKNTLIGLDVSGSMGWGAVANSHITPRVASAAMALITLNAEPRTQVIGFTGGSLGYSYGYQRRSANETVSDTVTELNIDPRQRLDDVVKTISNLPMGATDCALPMSYAIEQNLPIDTFVIYTDNETWAGRVHPFQELQNYRQHSGRNAKSIVVGLTATNVTIADPRDPRMLDVVGFDASAPQVISDFAADRV